MAIPETLRERMCDGRVSREEVRVFVYGTLKSGGGAAHLLRGCRMEGRAEVRGTLYDVNGRYPVLVLGGGDRVGGEVWRGPAAVLPELDEYEGVAEGLFGRVEAEVEGETCWVYVAGPLLVPRLTPERRIPSGVWTGPTANG